MTKATEPSQVKELWTKKVRKFMAEFLDEHPVLSRFHQRASLVLHGSTTLGIDDAFSDLDFWFLLPESDLVEFGAVSETRFFQIKVNGKPGHIDAKPAEQLSKRFQDCDLALIFQMQRAEIITDHAGLAGDLQRLSRKPMRDEVSDAFFCYHYILMCDWRQSCRNPMARTDPVGALLALPEFITHALKAAIVLDGAPYPYGKWLHRVSLTTPTGRLLAPSMETVLDRIAEDGLRSESQGPDHPIGSELDKICRIVTEAARAKGNDDPWLKEWWFHINQAVTGIQGIAW